MGRETEKRQLRAGNFTMNNGRVLSTINLLREKYNALRSVEKAVSYEGIERQEFVDSVNFLEAKVTGKGIRLLGGGIADNMVDLGD